MGDPKPTFSLDAQPEVFFSSAAVSGAVGRAVRAGRARRLGPRLYTRSVHDPPEAVVLRNWARIAAGYFPGAVIVGRSAVELAPAADGSVFLASDREREVRVPGLRLRPQPGAGPLPGDTRWMGNDVYMSSRARAFLENLRPSRSRAGAATRTLRREELEDALEEYGRLNPDSLNRLRDDARRLAPSLGMEAELEQLDELVGALLRTKEARLLSPRARARAAGAPFDPQRIERFEALAAHLLRVGLPDVPANPAHDLSTFAFYEAFFSNYIEGTEFTVDEAERIVFRGEVPAQRPQDAHDVLGTYRLVVDDVERARVPASADELVELLRAQHRSMLSRRPEIGPGEWKRLPNQVGGRLFVAPELVEGTLRESFRVYDSLPAGFARAVFAMFLVSEVHPFADGNGRTARLLMNAELTAAGGQRIVVSTRDRDDYLRGLRGMTNRANADAYVAIMAALQARTHDTDYSGLPAARAALAAWGAFEEADEGSVALAP